MPSPKQVTAIFDIGKTNKKFLLFDEDYTVLDKYQIELEQTVDDDGDPCEDIEKLEVWISKQFNSAQKKYRIQGLNFSGYGASLVHIDKNGSPVAPLYNYLKSYPEDLLKKFYEAVGGKEQFSLETASPPMGMLNSGLQIYWLKHQKPKTFQKIKASLHFPNYLSYLFTRKKVSELTSIGCHTGLWNYKNNKYHNWLTESKIKSLLPKIQSTTKFFETKESQKIGPGIHDSSAALTPYLLGMDEAFMLISTGTWSITFNPFNDEPLTYKELEKDCLCYLNINGNQVKASRLFLGAEYSHQIKKISEHFAVSENEFVAKPDTGLIKQLVRKNNNNFKLELEQAYNSGPFPQKVSGSWDLNNFSTSKEAYHQLMIDLVAIQSESVKLAGGSNNIEKLIVTGGFSQNELFVTLLASFFPEKKVYISKLSNASALGAAMVLNKNLVIASGAKQSHSENHDSSSEGASSNSGRGRKDIEDLLGLKLVKPIEGLHLKNYSWV